MDWRKIGKKLLFPPVWLMVIFVVISAVAMVYIFVEGMEQSIPAYIVYVLAFYTLSVVTLFCVMVLPKQYTVIKQKIYDNPFGNRVVTDKVFRTNISLSVSFVINMFFCGHQPLVMVHTGKLLVYGIGGVLCDYGGDAFPVGALCPDPENRYQYLKRVETLSNLCIYFVVDKSKLEWCGADDPLSASGIRLSRHHDLCDGPVHILCPYCVHRGYRKV